MALQFLFYVTPPMVSKLHRSSSSISLYPFFPSVKCLFLPLLLPDPPQPPVIIGLEGEEVKAGSLLLLQCVSYGGNPLATLHWTKVNLWRHLLWRRCRELLVTLSAHHEGANGPLRRVDHLFLQNGEVLSISWKEDAEAQKSISTLRLMIIPADNQAELSCESANLVSQAPLSVSRKITVLCE